MEIYVSGDSFIKRLQRFITRNRVAWEIGASVRVRLNGVSGGRRTTIPVPVLGSLPEVVIVACEGNNICDPSVSPLTVAREIFSRFSDRGRVVVFCSVLYRRENGGSGRGYPVPYGFRQRASELNSASLELTESSPRHQFYELDRRLIRFTCNDDVHLTAEGERKLFWSLRRAIQFGLQALEVL